MGKSFSILKTYPYLYEIPLFYVFLNVLNYVFLPEVPAFVGISPHPYWIGVLLFGFRYGVFAGLGAGLVAAFLYLASSWYLVERYLFEDITFYLLPIFFIVFGALIGVGVYRYRQTIHGLELEGQQFKKNETALLAEIQDLEQIKTGLEKKIVTRMTTLVTVYEGARKLETTNLEDLYQAILEFTSRTLDASECAIFVRKGSAFKRIKTFGWQDYYKRPETYKAGEGLVGRAGLDGKVISIRDLLNKGDDQDPELSQSLGDCLLAGPLRKGGDGDVIGVLGIFKMPFVQFNSSTVSLFNFLLGWFSRSIGRSYYIEDLQSGEIIDPILNIYSYKYFESRFDHELDRSNTYYLPLSLVLIKIKGLNLIESDKRDHLIKMICELLKKTAREMDIVSHFNEELIPFAVLMITASEKQMFDFKSDFFKLWEPIERELPTEVKSSIKIEMGISSFSPQLKSQEALVNQAKSQLV